MKSANEDNKMETRLGLQTLHMTHGRRDQIRSRMRDRAHQTVTIMMNTNTIL